MRSQRHASCWEFWNCPDRVRKKCPAYATDSGTDCWMVADNFRTNSCPKVKKVFKNCWDCDWFKKMNPKFH